jgi:hypothetical protein
MAIEHIGFWGRAKAKGVKRGWFRLPAGCLNDLMSARRPEPGSTLDGMTCGHTSSLSNCRGWDDAGNVRRSTQGHN